MPFRVNQNRKFLFPEGKSVISQDKIIFFSVWADYKGTSYQIMVPGDMDGFEVCRRVRATNKQMLIAAFLINGGEAGEGFPLPVKAQADSLPGDKEPLDVCLKMD